MERLFFEFTKHMWSNTLVLVFKCRSVLYRFSVFCTNRNLVLTIATCGFLKKTNYWWFSYNFDVLVLLDIISNSCQFIFFDVFFFVLEFLSSFLWWVVGEIGAGSVGSRHLIPVWLQRNSWSFQRIKWILTSPFFFSFLAYSLLKKKRKTHFGLVGFDLPDWGISEGPNIRIGMVADSKPY